jgi:hypothetical protein
LAHQIWFVTPVLDHYINSQDKSFSTLNNETKSIDEIPNSSSVCAVCILSAATCEWSQDISAAHKGQIKLDGK